MLTVDDIVKLLLAISFSAALLMIAFQIARFIGALANSVNDVRRMLRNLSTASDFMLDDYNRVRSFFHNSGSVFGLIGNIFKPFQSMASFVASRRQGEKSEQDEEMP